MEEKYIYIKKGHGFIEFDTPMSEELNGNVMGTTWQDYVAGKWVPLSAEQVAFREEHPNASVLEVWNMEITPVPVRTLEQAKRDKVRQIDIYDKSSLVNGFTVNGSVDGWFTPEERSNYRSSIDSAKLLGVETLQFYIGNLLLTITPTQAEYMLAQIQLYADQCFIVTKQHKIAVNALTTIEAVDAYDYRQGYPQKIDFTLPI